MHCVRGGDQPDSLFHPVLPILQPCHVPCLSSCEASLRVDVEYLTTTRTRTWNWLVVHYCCFCCWWAQYDSLSTAHSTLCHHLHLCCLYRCYCHHHQTTLECSTWTTTTVVVAPPASWLRRKAVD